MIEYRYDNVTIDNIAVVAVKIGKTVGVNPTGLADSGSSTTVYFATDLTPEQKTSLDTLMTTPSIDQIPTNTGNTTFVFNESGFETTLETNLGTTVDIYPMVTGYELQFGKKLSNAEKNSVRGAFTNQITEKV